MTRDIDHFEVPAISLGSMADPHDGSASPLAPPSRAACARLSPFSNPPVYPPPGIDEIHTLAELRDAGTSFESEVLARRTEPPSRITRA